MTASLRFERVALVRGGRPLWRDVSFALAAGDALRVTGPNGAGKSSLLRLAAGLLPAAAGTVAATGGVALADDRLALDDRTLVAALGFWAALDRVDGDDGGRAADALGAVGLGHLADVPVALLSAGQRRRAGLARVVASGAGVWLLDEPANALDAAGVAILEGLVAAHRLAGGIAVVAAHGPLALPDAGALALDAHAASEA